MGAASAGAGAATATAAIAAVTWKGLVLRQARCMSKRARGQERGLPDGLVIGLVGESAVVAHLSAAASGAMPDHGIAGGVTYLSV